MTLFLVLLGIAVYLLIGGIAVGIATATGEFDIDDIEDDLEVVVLIVFLWPLFLIFLAIWGVVWCVGRFGILVGRQLYKGTTLLQNKTKKEPKNDYFTGA